MLFFSMLYVTIPSQTNGIAWYFIAIKGHVKPLVWLGMLTEYVYSTCMYVYPLGIPRSVYSFKHLVGGQITVL